MNPGICPIHRVRGCTCGGNPQLEERPAGCLCVHPARDHVIDMKAPRPLLRCIAFLCDCTLFASVVTKEAS